MLAVLLLFCVPLEINGFHVALQNMIDTASYLSKNAALSLGVATPDRTISLAAGLKNRERGIFLQPDDRVGLGSGTKMFTAAAVLKTVESGRLGLDDLALPHVDPLVRQHTGQSLVEYMGPRMRNVTVRHLLHMTSGIRDFRSFATRMEQIRHPTREINIDDVLRHVQWVDVFNKRRGKYEQPDGGFNCEPGLCGEYSSTNYFILGLMLAQLSGNRQWWNYDQSAFLPMALRQKMPQTVFPVRGQCGEFTDVHGYEKGFGLNDMSMSNDHLLDNHDMSCNVAFAVANALSTGKETAIFMKALLGPDLGILQPKTIAEMTKFRWLETGLANKKAIGQFYGMGLRDMSAQLVLNPVSLVTNPEIFTSGILLGHDGWSTGWNSFNAYAPQRDFAFSFLTNFNINTIFFNFIARKTYDITSATAAPRVSPLRISYENKRDFFSQKKNSIS